MRTQLSTSSPATEYFGLLLWSGNIAVLVILAVTATITLKASRDAFATRAAQSAENLARTFGLGIASDIRLIENGLITAAREANQLGGGRRADAAALEVIARDQRSLLPHADLFRFTDEEGRVLRTEEAGVVVKDRGYFSAARSFPDRLAVSEPLQDRIAAMHGIFLARARLGPGGRFDGIVYANLSTRHFIEQFSGVDIGPRGAVTLRTESLQLVARHALAEGDANVGTRVVSPELKQALAENPEKGSFISRTALDQVERVTSYEKVPGYPLIVLVGLGTDDFFQPWRRQVTEVSALCVMLGTLVVTLSSLAHWTHRRHLAVQREQLAMLENDLVGMVRLRNRTAVWHNAALASLFGYEGETLVGRSSRMLYPDDESHERIGVAYARLAEGGSFRTQIKLLRKDGQLVWIDLSGVRLSSSDSLWMMVDVSVVKESEAEACRRALHDPLTGLVNRAGVDDEILILFRSNRRVGTSVAVCYIDLDGFKAVNDRHGHEAGDALLKEAARRISGCTRQGDVVARMGGDEFVAAIGHLASPGELLPALERLLAALATPFVLPNGEVVSLSASVGAAWLPPEGADPRVVIAQADEAMYQAKHAGKNRMVISPAMQTG